MNNILITGHKKGLGKFLKNYFSKEKYKVFTLNNKIYKKKIIFKFILHCAARRPHYKKKYTNLNYIDSNIFLTLKLTKLNFKRFIYISSVDVYPKMKKKIEKKKIDYNKLSTIYQISKYTSERILLNICPKKTLILRLPSLIGKEMQQNVFYDIIFSKKKKIKTHYSNKSVFNLISYNSVLKIILKIIEKNKIGIFNIANKKNSSIEDLSKNYKKHVTYGKKIYFVGNISTKKIKNIK